MTTQYSWSFPQLDVIYSEGPYSNVVSAVHWIYQATDGTRYETCVGCTPLESPSGQFVNYNDLTPEIVTGWVVGTLGEEKVAEMTEDLDGRLAAARSPKGGAELPPWAGQQGE
jgi:hypothetical protein